MQIQRLNPLRAIAAVLLALTSFTSNSAADTATRFAYVVNAYDSTISQFVVDAANGRLRHNGWVPTGKFPSCIVVHPSGKFAFVTQQTGQKISAYSIDPDTGRLTEIKGSPFDSRQVSPYWAVTDPKGKFLFVAARNSSNLAVMSINETTGALSSIEGSPYPGEGLARPRSVAIHPSGKFVYMANIDGDSVSAYRTDLDKGKLKTVPGSPFTVGKAPQYMQLHPNGKYLFVSNWFSRDVSTFSIDASTGALHKKQHVSLAEGVYPFGLGMHPSGHFLYAANWFGGTFGFSVNADSGELSPMPSSPFATKGKLPLQVEVEPMGRHAYVTNYDSHNVTSYEIDPASGSLRAQETTLSRTGPRSIAFVSGAKPVAFVPRFMYVANEQDNTLSIVNIDAMTGALKAEVKVATGKRPVAITVDSDSRLVFVANHDSDDINVFTIRSDGGLANVTGSPFKAGKNPNALALDSNGRNLYVSNRGSKTMTVYDIARNGTLTELRRTDLYAESPYPLTGEPADLVMHPADRGLFVPFANSAKVAGFRYYGDGVMVVGLDDYGSPYTLGANVTRIGWEPNGQYVYRLDAKANSVEAYTYAIHEDRGGLREVETSRSTATGKNPAALAFHPNARFMYVLNRDSEDIYAYAIDPLSAAIRMLPGRVKTGKNPSAITVEKSGRFLYVANAGSDNVMIYSIDHTSGKLTSAGAIPVGNQPSAFSVFTEMH